MKDENALCLDFISKDIKNICVEMFQVNPNHILSNDDNLALYIKAHNLFYLLCFIINKYQLDRTLFEEFMNIEFTTNKIAECILNAKQKIAS